MLHRRSHAGLAKNTSSFAMAAAIRDWPFFASCGPRPSRNDSSASPACSALAGTGEIVALTGHLAENELRGGLTFIERALGVEKAREFYEQETGGTTPPSPSWRGA